MKNCTREGRVVYNRKKHLWNFRDVLRVIRNYGKSVIFEVSVESFEAMIFAIETQGVIDFGGGTFAGGGTSRIFKLMKEKPALNEPNVLVIIEGKE